VESDSNVQKELFLENILSDSNNISVPHQSYKIDLNPANQPNGDTELSQKLFFPPNINGLLPNGDRGRLVTIF
jgi:hypothetical protein